MDMEIDVDGNDHRDHIATGDPACRNAYPAFAFIGAGVRRLCRSWCTRVHQEIRTTADLPLLSPMEIGSTGHFAMRNGGQALAERNLVKGIKKAERLALIGGICPKGAAALKFCTHPLRSLLHLFSQCVQLSLGQGADAVHADFLGAKYGMAYAADWHRVA